MRQSQPQACVLCGLMGMVCGQSGTLICADASFDISGCVPQPRAWVWSVS